MSVSVKRKTKTTVGRLESLVVAGEKRRRVKPANTEAPELAEDERAPLPSLLTVGKCADCGEPIERPRIDMLKATICARCDGDVTLAGMEPTARAIERHRLTIPEGLHYEGEITVGEVAAGRWAWGYKFRDTEPGLRPCEAFEPCRVIDDSDSRELAKARAARALAMRITLTWGSVPESIRRTLAAFADRLETEATPSLAEAYQKARGVRRQASGDVGEWQDLLPPAKAAALGLSTVTPTGIAANDPEAAAAPAETPPKRKSKAENRKSNGSASREAEPPTVTPAGIREHDPEARTEANEGNEVTKKPSSLPSLPSVQNSGQTFLCPFEELGRNRFNPRENFDRLELDEFGEKLKRDGQVQCILVRKAASGGGLRAMRGGGIAKWEIVAGERRALAAFRAGLPGVRAEVIENCDDARACELAIAENRDRKDISQVEYARGLQKLADLKQLDPKGLAADQGLSEQHVRNLLRLLKTPAEWQQLVIDGKIDGTHLRTAAPFLHVPAIAKQLKKELAGDDGKPSAAEWTDDVRSAAWRYGERLDRHVHTPDYSKSSKLAIEPSHPQWAELDVAEIDGRQYALNAKLAKKLLDQAEADWKKKAAKRSDKKDKQAAAKKEAMTPAERKKHEAEQRRKFEQRLENWFYDWLRVLCAAAVQPNGFCANCERGAVWITAWALWARPSNEYREREVLEELAGYKAKQCESDVVLKVLETRAGSGAGDLLHAYAARLLVDADGAPRGPTGGVNPVVHNRVVAVLARDVLGLDLPAAWRDDRDSPMREKFWNLHSKDQLAELGQELGLFIGERLKKSQAVDVFLAQQKPLPLPKELAKLVSQLQPAKGERASGPGIRNAARQASGKRKPR